MWRGEEASSPFLSSCVLVISSFAPPPPTPNKTTTTTTTKLAPATQAMIGLTLERLCVGQSEERVWRLRTMQGRGRWRFVRVTLILLQWVRRCARAGTYASSMAWCRTDCKVALNWSVALSYAHVLCARLFITWTTLITHPTLHFCTLYRHTKASRIVLAGNDARLFSALE